MRYPVMFYDVANTNIVLHGGYRFSTDYYTNTYIMRPDGYSGWYQLDDRPDFCTSAAVAYDPLGNAAYCYGGLIPPLSASSNLWRYKDENWTLVSQQGDRPPKLRGASMVYDPRGMMVGGDVFYLFGGYDGINITNGLWKLFPTSFGWNRVNYSGSIPNRYGGVMAYDAVHTQLVFFGGTSDFSGFPSANVYAFDLVADEWSLLTTTNPPPGLYECAGGGLPDNTRMWVYGGNRGFDRYTNGLWELNFSNYTWTSFCPDFRPEPGPTMGAFAYATHYQMGVSYGGGYNVSTINSQLWMVADYDMAITEMTPGAGDDLHLTYRGLPRVDYWMYRASEPDGTWYFTRGELRSRAILSTMTVDRVYSPSQIYRYRPDYN
jgi:hypothetical protein